MVSLLSTSRVIVFPVRVLTKICMILVSFDAMLFLFGSWGEEMKREAEARSWEMVPGRGTSNSEGLGF